LHLIAKISVFCNVFETERKKSVPEHGQGVPGPNTLPPGSVHLTFSASICTFAYQKLKFSTPS
jgi:hypothetical protein